MKRGPTEIAFFIILVQFDLLDDHVGITSASIMLYSDLASLSSSLSSSFFPMPHPFSPCSHASGHHPSSIDRFGTPFITAFIPEVPLASIGRTGVFSQTSTPLVIARPVAME